WTESWTRDVTTQTGRLILANRLPPPLQPCKHCTDTNTPDEIYGRLTQCRTGYGFIGKCYASFMPTKFTSYSCGELHQTREHVFLH
ncbi:hypothetical protein BDR05DRAFT_866419, partial [Suillus weaverae]